MEQLTPRQIYNREYGPATYTVKMEDQEKSDTSRRLIKFEDAVLAS